MLIPKIPQLANMLIPKIPITKVEPRLALVLTLVYSVLVWKVAGLWLAWYAVLLFFLWWKTNCWHNLPAQTLGRTLFFCILWSGLAFLAQSFPLVWEYFFTPTAYLIKQLLELVIKNTLLFCRLFLLLFFSLWLTTFVSARALALALTWFIHPFLRSRAWQVALSLALMLKFLPLIHYILTQMRICAQARHLPHKGWSYWKNALPQLFRLLHNSTYTQALAITSRHLDTPEAWYFLPPPDSTSSILCLAMGIAIILPFII